MRYLALFIGLFLLFIVPNVHRAYADTPAETSICDSISDAGQKGDCNGCMADNKHVWTAIGCISTERPTGIFEKMLSLGMGAAGGIAFLLILFGGLQIMTSAGNPEQLTAGRELVSAAITGLLLVIFSIFLLRFMGMNIIGIPGLEGVTQ